MKKVITIGRQFGSGGHSIGKAVAKQLGIPFYDKEMLNRIAAETGFAPEYIEKTSEDASSNSSLLWNLVMGNKSVEKRIDDKDTRRKLYYSHYTNRIWGAPENYHITLNSSALGEDACIQEIIRLASF